MFGAEHIAAAFRTVFVLTLTTARQKRAANASESKMATFLTGGWLSQRLKEPSNQKSELTSRLLRNQVLRRK